MYSWHIPYLDKCDYLDSYIYKQYKLLFLYNWITQFCRWANFIWIAITLECIIYFKPRSGVQCIWDLQWPNNISCQCFRRKRKFKILSIFLFLINSCICFHSAKLSCSPTSVVIIPVCLLQEMYVLVEFAVWCCF